MVAEGHRYFVRQTFNRARDHFDEGIKGYFLFCHYKEYLPAKEHYEALVQDTHRFLYDWENEEHRKKLTIAAGQPPGYKLYSNTFINGWERLLTNRIKQKIRTYIQRQGWIPKSSETVSTRFYPHFGEVMIALRFRQKELSVTFEEIEKMF